MGDLQTSKSRRPAGLSDRSFGSLSGKQERMDVGIARGKEIVHKEESDGCCNGGRVDVPFGEYSSEEDIQLRQTGSFGGHLEKGRLLVEAREVVD